MKIYAVCQSGLGTSFMVEMNIKNALKARGVDLDDFQIDHGDVGSVSANMGDYFFFEKTLQDTLTNLPADKMIPLNSIIDKKEIQEKVDKILADNNIA
ncbi:MULTISPECIES: PTS sugar transporter subunit IIB [Lactobacillales]|uniref:PTS sugar transporter subunit IIB n=1 Tax=Lactobacillales TaxID=186826 RepID=UPI0011EFAE88|nr:MULTISPECIES: PTS sugar transporter subunit IIB [Lactobacillales]KAF3306235.1 PTS lactose transporter subunit IIB [Carnobacterium sp. PL17GRE32]MEC1387381.1 PTS sugar transporter subunit IIB [Aerococcus viridans]